MHATYGHTWMPQPMHRVIIPQRVAPRRSRVKKSYPWQVKVSNTDLGLFIGAAVKPHTNFRSTIGPWYRGLGDLQTWGRDAVKRKLVRTIEWEPANVISPRYPRLRITYWYSKPRLLFLNFYHTYLLSVSVCGHLNAAAHMWRSEGQFAETGSLLPALGSGDWAWFLSLSCQVCPRAESSPQTASTSCICLFSSFLPHSFLRAA